MSINMSKDRSSTVVDATATVVDTPVAEQQYDIVADTNNQMNALVGTPEVEALTQLVVFDQPDTIVSFGMDAASQLATAADTVLNSMNMKQLNDTGTMMTNLTKIMEKFDPDDLKEKDRRGLAKLLYNAKREIQQMLDKYDTMGKEIDGIFIQLRKYEDEIKKSNQNLENMFQANVNTYYELLKYIAAGKQLDNELTEYIGNLRENPNADPFELQSLEQGQMLLQQRVGDLEVAQNVAMQSIPMLKVMENSNYNLIRKINSAFIITLPVFKQGIAQAMMLKRQKIMADSMKALDDKTNEMIVKNANNTVAMSKATAQLASGSSIKAETLEASWRTIMDGIAETQRIEADAKTKREEDSRKLAAIKSEFDSKYKMPKASK